jgi:prepilin-type N-terminal cleavage/methylation domain-containing protein
MKKHSSGFTLVEMMVTILVAGVLTSLSVNQIKGLTYRVRMKEPQIAIATYARMKEAHFAVTGIMNGSMDDIGYAPPISQYFDYTDDPAFWMVSSIEGAGSHSAAAGGHSAECGHDHSGSGTDGGAFAPTALAKSNNNGKGKGHVPVTICHRAGPRKWFNITVDESAVPAHLGHGDYLGACRPEDGPDEPIPEDPEAPEDPGDDGDPYAMVTICNIVGPHNMHTMEVFRISLLDYLRQGATEGPCPAKDEADRQSLYVTTKLHLGPMCSVFSRFYGRWRPESGRVLYGDEEGRCISLIQ